MKGSALCPFFPPRKKILSGTFGAILDSTEPLAELCRFAAEPPAAVRHLSSCVTGISLLCVHFTVSLAWYQICGRAAFWDNKRGDMVGFNNWRWETETKMGADTICFFYHADAETFVMRAFSRDAQRRREKVRVNPIGEITQMYFYPSSFLSKWHEARRSTGIHHLWFISGSWPFMTSPLPVWSQGIRSPQWRGVCSLCVVGSGGRCEPGGVTWNTEDTRGPTAAQTNML